MKCEDCGLEFPQGHAQRSPGLTEKLLHNTQRAGWIHLWSDKRKKKIRGYWFVSKMLKTKWVFPKVFYKRQFVAKKCVAKEPLRSKQFLPKKKSSQRRPHTGESQSMGSVWRREKNTPSRIHWTKTWLTVGSERLRVLCPGPIKVWS